MKKYILFVNGILAGRYTQEINGDDIPVEAIEVSDEVFFQTISEQDGIWKLVNGAIVKEPHPEPAIEDLAIARLGSINAVCEQSIAIISAGYPASEVLSWPKQETEARAWLADNNAHTPLIDALATAREISKSDLVDRIIEKADLFAAVSGQYIGHRQALEDQLNALLERHNNPGPGVDPVTPAEVEAIQW